MIAQSTNDDAIPTSINQSINHAHNKKRTVIATLFTLAGAHNSL
jgi:hypothetical protein